MASQRGDNDSSASHFQPAAQICRKDEEEEDEEEVEKEEEGLPDKCLLLFSLPKLDDVISL